MAEKVRIHVFVPQRIADLLDCIAEEEHRTKSAIIELALLAYAKKSYDLRSRRDAKSSRSDT
jgi:predicted transcriptional regulator